MSENLPLFEWLDEEDRNDSGYTLYNLSNREAFALKDTIEHLTRERDELVKLVHAIRWQLEISDARYDTGHRCWTDMIEVADKHKGEI